MDPRLGHDSNPRLQKIDKAALLASCPLFAGLSQWEITSISRLMRLVEFRKSEVVFREGGEAEAFYVVVLGRFEVSSQSSPQGRRALAFLRRGDYFGEMSLLTHQPHSATITAQSDSLVLELKKDDFARAIEQNALVSLEISRRLTARVRGAADHRSRALLKSDVITLSGASNREPTAEFAIDLAAGLCVETRLKTIVVALGSPGTAEERWWGRPVPLGKLGEIESLPSESLLPYLVRHPAGFEILHLEGGTSAERPEESVTPLLNHLAAQFRFILVHVPGPVGEQALRVFSQSDAAFLLTDSDFDSIGRAQTQAEAIRQEAAFPEEKIHVIIREKLHGIRTTQATKRELFGRKICYSLPARDRAQEPASRPAVLEDPDADYSRVVRHLARRVSDNLVGLALGSGAAMGLAHIGVLKVLEREGIQIDLVAGSSIGALIGSLYAVGKTPAEIEQIALGINMRVLFGRLLDFHLWPWRGLIWGRGVMQHFKDHLGSKTFEDCRTPLIVTGANLTTHEIVAFDSGFVSDAVRASIAIPAVFDPVRVKGDVVVDGGILTPLPIRPLREAGINKIIAVNVFPSTKDILGQRILEEESREKESWSLRRRSWPYRFWRRTSDAVRSRLVPNIPDILMNTIQAMESRIAEVEEEEADLVLRPVVPGGSWIELYRPIPYIRRGEEEALRQLSGIRALVAPSGA